MSHAPTPPPQTSYEAVVSRSSPRKPLHVPVMKREVLDIINPKAGQIIVDMTFGAGGHSRSLLSECSGATIIGMDRDPLAQDLARRLEAETSNFRALAGCFTDVERLLSDQLDTTTTTTATTGAIDAVLFDFGASSMQYDTATRGFSLSKDGPLNMRMDENVEEMTAEDVVNNLDESALYTIIKKYGEEKQARRVASAIVDARYSFGRITTTKQLANIIAAAIQGGPRLDSLMRNSHVATKTFQALRIFVNDELNQIYNGLNVANRLLRSTPDDSGESGLCVCISFHSLEDRIVKRNFNGTNINEDFNVSLSQRSKTKSSDNAALPLKWTPYIARNGVVAGSSQGLVLPTPDDVRDNPRSRSAKLRAARKLLETQR